MPAATGLSSMPSVGVWRGAPPADWRVATVLAIKDGHRPGSPRCVTVLKTCVPPALGSKDVKGGSNRSRTRRKELGAQWMGTCFDASNALVQRKCECLLGQRSYQSRGRRRACPSQELMPYTLSFSNSGAHTERQRWPGPGRKQSDMHVHMQCNYRTPVGSCSFKRTAKKTAKTLIW